MALTEWTCGCSSKMGGNLQVYAPLEAEIPVLPWSNEVKSVLEAEEISGFSITEYKLLSMSPVMLQL